MENTLQNEVPNATKSAQEITNKVEEIFTKLQRNMEHNTRVFQEKAQSLLDRIGQAEEQLKRVLVQLDPAAEAELSNQPEVSIALSDNSQNQ